MQTSPLDGRKKCNMHAAGECIPFVSFVYRGRIPRKYKRKQKDLQKSTHDHALFMGTQFRIHFQV